MIIPATISTAAHTDHPSRIRHLIVDLAQGGGHLVGQGAGDDHDVGLPRRGTEDDAQAVLIVARGAEMHHLDGAAGEAEGHGPEGALARPVGDLVEGGSCGEDVSYCGLRKSRGVQGMRRLGGHVQSVLHGALFLLLARQWDFSTDAASDWQSADIFGLFF